MSSNTLAAVRGKVEEVIEWVPENTDADTETLLSKLQEVTSFIDSLSLDSKIDCCRG